MVKLETFIEACERDLLLEQNHLSKNTLELKNNLSNEHRLLCKPIIDFIENKNVIEIDKVYSSPKERILVYRPLAFVFRLNTEEPVWSSFLLNKAVEIVKYINDSNLSEIVISFLEIMCEFDVPLNETVHNFCIDFSKSLAMHYRNRFDELSMLSTWKDNRFCTVTSCAYLQFYLTAQPSPKYLLQTIKFLIQNKYFNIFIEENKYLLENTEYKVDFIDHLSNSALPQKEKELILRRFNTSILT